MKPTITLSEQTYQALQREAQRSQMAVDALVEEWLRERLELEPGPLQYPQSTGKESVLRETRLAEQKTVTLELPCDLYDGLQSLGAGDGIDPVQVIADLVKRAQQLRITDAQANADATPTGSDVLRQLANLAQDLGVEDLAEQHDHYLYGTEKR